jgi:hypothetical protein
MDTAGNQSQAGGGSLRDGPVRPGIVIAPAHPAWDHKYLLSMTTVEARMPDAAAPRLWMAERLRERGYGMPGG